MTRRFLSLGLGANDGDGDGDDDDDLRPRSRRAPLVPRRLSLLLSRSRGGHLGSTNAAHSLPHLLLQEHPTGGVRRGTGSQGAAAGGSRVACVAVPCQCFRSRNDDMGLFVHVWNRAGESRGADERAYLTSAGVPRHSRAVSRLLHRRHLLSRDDRARLAVHPTGRRDARLPAIPRQGKAHPLDRHWRLGRVHVHLELGDAHLAAYSAAGSTGRDVRSGALHARLAVVAGLLG